jgi:aminopeptidase N
MSKITSAVALFLLLYINCWSQIERYTSSENPHYWKNRQPYNGYWQQDVYYQIKATLDDQTDIISGQEQLTYRNNSPDTLLFVFFHLYQNAFVPGSYLDDLNKANNNNVKYGKYELQGLGIEILSFETTFINGKTIQFNNIRQHDNTIMKVMLPEPLLPGNDVTFNMTFKTYYDKTGQRRRMQMYESWGYKHYNGCQWYPKISVYDKRNGWDTNQHLGKEFYGNFGDFDVELTFANHFIVEATGVLTNEKEVLPDELRKKLDIKNFKSKPEKEIPSVIIEPNGSTKTWKYHAENVHDFAFTADPTYRLGETYWNGIRCVAIAQEPHCYGWQNAAEYTARIIETYSRDFGMYAYPKMVVADARDGMEYPMITLDNGLDPGYRGLLCHEVGHNWFYGMVGSNETYRALLDEGFTQFLTAWCLEKLEGRYIRRKDPGPLDQKITEPMTQQYATVYGVYLNAAINDNDGFINTHSDMFNSALGHGGGYGMVYRKTATMLYNLQYVLGDDLFLSAMQHYFNQWKFCHPYPEDFRNSITQVVKYDMSWFFDQWLETNKKLDYKICGYRKIQQHNNTDTYEIKFKRKARMQSPLDFSVYSNCGNKYDFHIPNTWFTKQTEATTLSKWEGWDKLRKYYKANVTIPCGISRIVIDTTDRFADVYRLDNSFPRPYKLVFDKWQKPAYADWKSYVFYVRPTAWFNNYDGIKIGVHAEGNYLNTLHFFSTDLWINTTVGQNSLPPSADINKNDPASFRIYYKTPLHFLSPDLSAWITGGMLDGLTYFKTGTGFSLLDDKLNLFSEYKLLYRRNTNTLDYLLYPEEWQSSMYNTTLTIGAKINYRMRKISGSVSVENANASLFSDYSFSKISFTHIASYLGKKLDWRMRMFAQYGYGTALPNESALYLASANPEELMENPWTRSRAFVPYSWLGYGSKTNHFHQGGGLNLRGYAGYLVPEQINGEQRYFYKALSGAAINFEVDVDKFIPLKPRFTRNWLKADLYLFGDAGSIVINNSKEKLIWSNLKSDAGIGAVITIKKFGRFNALKPLSIRCDMPLVLSSVPAAEGNYLKLRYVIGIGRSF